MEATKKGHFAKSPYSGPFTLTSLCGLIGGHGETDAVALVNLTGGPLKLFSWDRGLQTALEVPTHGEAARVEWTEEEQRQPPFVLHDPDRGAVPFPAQWRAFRVKNLPRDEHEVRWGVLTMEQQSDALMANGGWGTERQELPEGTVWPVYFIVSQEVVMASLANEPHRSRADVWMPGRSLTGLGGDEYGRLGLCQFR